MANTQSNSRQKTNRRSGSSDLPTVLSYPKLLNFDEALSIRNVFSYVVKHYGTKGMSVLIYRKKEIDEIVVLFGDWSGNNLDISPSSDNYLVPFAQKFIGDYLQKFVSLMATIRIDQAQYFFAIVNDSLMLVDMQISLNKFASPGMIKEMFGNICPVQEVIKTEIIDERSVDYIMKGTGSYAGDLILKPSSFKMHHDQLTNKYTPMYVEMRR